MILATTSLLIALASVASQAATTVLEPGNIVSPNPFPARIAADTAFKVEVSYPMDTRTAAEKAASPPADLTKSFYQVVACLQTEGSKRGDPCVKTWVSEPVSNYHDATELRAEIPTTDGQLIKPGRHFISYLSFCTFDADKYDVCELGPECVPCANKRAGTELKTDVFEVVLKGAEDDVPDSQVLPSDSAAGMTTVVSSIAAAVVAGAMAIVA